MTYYQTKRLRHAPVNHSINTESLRRGQEGIRGKKNLNTHIFGEAFQAQLQGKAAASLIMNPFRGRATTLGLFIECSSTDFSDQRMQMRADFVRNHGRRHQI
jgi:hypothetical protein